MDFKNVPKKYRPIPFWSWNEKLDTAETVNQIEMMEEQGIGGFFMHARGGLQTEYMGEEWFENVKVCADVCEKNGMHPWAYDENGWPSGFGNGIVNGKGVEYQQKYLRVAPASEACENIIATVGEYRFYYDVNPFYVDTLDGKVIKDFIENIYVPYYEKFNGKIRGFFTDEPQISRNGIPWSFILPEEYKAAYGDDLIPHLPELFFDIDGYKTTRIRFWKLITDLFSKNFMKQIYDWCISHGFGFTGHLVLEESLESQLVSNGACMPHYEYMTIPGMDWLGRHNNRSLTPYQVGSAARQNGQKQVLSETFAMCGHNIGHDELKWIYEYQMVRGINLLCQHLEGYSNRGIRKRDYPPAMYIQQPWWKEYKTFNDAMSRIGMLLSDGDDNVDVLLIHPQTTAWTMYNDDCAVKINEENKNARGSELLAGLQKELLDEILILERKHINFHLGDETVMERHGKAEDGKLVIGNKKYSKVIVLPGHTDFFPNTERLLDEFTKNGGIKTSASELEDNNIIDVPDITYCERAYGDFTLYYFVNSTENTYDAYIEKGAKVMDPVTGELYAFDGHHVFHKYESLVVIDDGTCRKNKEQKAQGEDIDLSGEWNIVSCTENSLTLDYCDYYFDDVLEEKNGYILNAMYRAIDKGKPVRIRCEYKVCADYVPEKLYLACETPEIFDIRVNGELVDKHDCGYFRDKAFRKLDISRYFKVGENIISAEVDFCQSETVYKNIEKSRCFESEKNKLTFDMEIEAMYLVGDFSVTADSSCEELPKNACRYPAGVKFVINAPKTSVALDKINRNGFPFFAGEITLEKTFDGKDITALDFEKCGVNVVKAEINGVFAGKFMYEPYRTDISHLIKDGENTVRLTLVNNVRNLLGPHHLAEGESYSVGPGSFYKEACIWYRVNDPARWNDGYCFTDITVKNK
ncbi:MAG: hypothetical protein IKV97_03135 [Clostridia bacterium]|nr:hypothetical protein [Clostridia bacterium]